MPRKRGKSFAQQVIDDAQAMDPTDPKFLQEVRIKDIVATSLPLPVEKLTVVCSNCSEANDVGEAICTECGEVLTCCE